MLIMPSEKVGVDKSLFVISFKLILEFSFAYVSA